MFQNAIVFNKSLITFNVSNVTNMGGMFSGAFTFNKPLDSWNVSKVTNMNRMFNNTTAFNQYLGSWNVTNVVDFQNMFYAARSFNQSFFGNWNFTAASASYKTDLLNRYPSGPTYVITYPTNFYSMFSSSGLSPETCYSVLTSFYNNLTTEGIFSPGFNLGPVPMFSQALLNSDKYILWGAIPQNYNGDWNMAQSQSIRDNVFKTYYSTNELITFRQANWSVSYVKMVNGLSFNIYIPDPIDQNINTLVQLNIPQFTISQFVTTGYSVSQLLAGGYSMNQIIASEYPVNNLLTTDGYQLSDLSNVIFTKSILTQSNITVNQLFDAGFSITQLVTNGFYVSDLSSCVFTKPQWQSAGYVPLQLFDAGFSISTFFTDGFQLSDLSSCPFTKEQWTAQYISPVQLQGAGFSIQNLITYGFQLEDLTATTYTGTQWIAAGYTIIQLFAAGFTTQQMVTLGLPVPRFSFEVASSALNDPNTAIYPILNANNSFTGIYITRGKRTSIHIISIYWVSYTNLSTQDGLNFSKTPYFSESSLKITNFGGVPLAIMTGTSDAAFYHFSGQITATDVPTVPNHSLNSCFYGATCSNFGNINAWDISGVTDLTAAFTNCVNFNSPLDKWSTQAVTSMINTFSGCSSFTQDISMWNFSGVIPTISQGSMFNILNGTDIDAARTSKFLLTIINSM
jgi:hypothetical protein